MIKKILWLLIFSCIVAGVIYRANLDKLLHKYADPAYTDTTNYISGLYEETVLLIKPCSIPITYSIESFDTRFGISKTYFSQAIAEAEAIWEKPYGKNLFDYKPNSGHMKVNLMYDYRQEATQKLSSIGVEVSNTKESYNQLKQKFDALKAQYATASAEYTQRVTDFKQKSSDYQTQVSYWNSKGGAPKATYNQIQETRKQLESEMAQINALATKNNELVSEINSLVVVLNRLAGTLNLKVDTYNAIGASRGESFEEGLYESGFGHKQIDIFEFSNHTKLVRVLAHELGHALGLDHVEDPKAIMYKLNQGENEVLTKTDLNALKAMCAK